MLWDQPDAFDPGRFAPERRAARDRYRYQPVGAGPRLGVGGKFAQVQAQIILATLLARVSFEPSGPSPRPVMHMTIRPDPGVVLAVRPVPATGVGVLPLPSRSDPLG
jgi:cytochrome P450